MDYVRVGIIGFGNIGSMHADNIFNNKVKGMKLTAICDEREIRLDVCKDRYKGILCYQNHIELIHSGNVDAVVIAVPHRFHAQIAMDALKAGINVLVEKPIDVTVTEAQKLIEVAKKTNQIFAIMFNQRTNALFQKARDIVQSGKLGELKRSVWIITNWYRTQQYYDSGSWRATWSGEGGGVLLNQAPHNLDLWQWICGMPKSVRAFCNVAKYHRIEVEDDATIYAQYENGATGVFITSTGEYPGTNRLEITGDKGKIVLENSTLKWWELEMSERDFCFTSDKSTPKIDCNYQEFTVTEKESAHIGILQNFTNAILNGEKLISPGEDGMHELMLSNAAYLSEWTGNQEVILPVDGKKFDSLLKEKCVYSLLSQDGEETNDSADESMARWQVRW